MAGANRPRNTVDALARRPFVSSDDGGGGIGPTLGEDVGAPPTGRPEVEENEEALPLTDAEPREFAEPRRPEQPLGSEIARAGEDLGDEVLRGPDVGAAGGFGASLGDRDPTPESVDPGADPDVTGGDNPLTDELREHAVAQSGRPDRSAPDETRAAAPFGSLNAGDGL